LGNFDGAVGSLSASLFIGPNWEIEKFEGQFPNFPIPKFQNQA